MVERISRLKHRNIIALLLALILLSSMVVPALAATDGTTGAELADVQAGLRVRFEGTVNRLPDEGFVGEWQIGERSVEVTTSTRIDASEGSAAVGVEVMVVARVQRGSSTLVAEVIIVKESRQHERSIEFRAPIQAIYEDHWVVRNVRVVIADAEITGAEPTVGYFAFIVGVWTGEKVIADKIRVVPPPDEVEYVEWAGIIEEIEDKYWVVGARRVLVTADTRIVGEPQVGLRAQVTAFKDKENDAWVAVRIVVHPSPATADVTINGAIYTIEGDHWIVGGIAIAIDENTRIDDSRFPAEEGNSALVRAVYYEDNDRLLALHIRVLPPSDDRSIVEVDGVVTAYTVRESIDVAGISMDITNETTIRGEPEVGKGAQVTARVIETSLQQTYAHVALRVLVETETVTVRGEIKELHVDDDFYGRWLMGETWVQVTEDTEIRGEPAVGRQAVAVGSWLADGVLDAVRVEVRPDRPVYREVQGRIEEHGDPGDNHIGEWVVNGFSFQVTEDTDLSGAEPQVGLMAFARVYQDGQRWIARQVRVAPPPAKPVAFRGIIYSFPDELMGSWRIGRTEVIVDENTRIDGEPEVGKYALVHGHALPTGAVQGLHIIVQDRPPDARPVEFRGEIEQLPDEGLMGLWVVDGRRVVVDNETYIEGDPAVGKHAWVQGTQANSHDPVQAKRIAVEERPDLEPEEVRFRDRIESLPNDPNYIGNWQVGEWVVVVSEDARLTGARPEAGKIAEVVGYVVAGEPRTVEARRVHVVERERPEPEEVRFKDRIRQLPDARGYLGRWQVGGWVVVVTEHTTVDGARPEVGKLAEVYGYRVAGEPRTVEARRVQVIEVEPRPEGGLIERQIGHVPPREIEEQ